MIIHSSVKILFFVSWVQFWSVIPPASLPGYFLLTWFHFLMCYGIQSFLKKSRSMTRFEFKGLSAAVLDTEPS